MIYKILFSLAVLVPQIAVAGERVCPSGFLPKSFRGAYIDQSTATGTNVELTASSYKFKDLRGELKITSCIVQGFRILTIVDGSNPDSVDNGVLLRAESGNLVVLPLSRVPTSDWPNRVTDLIRSATPAMVLQKAN
jgi:hypothetical protein